MTKRLVLRAIDRDEKGGVRQIIEQSIPADQHQIELALRRAPFRQLIAGALLGKGEATLDFKK